MAKETEKLAVNLTDVVAEMPTGKPFILGILSCYIFNMVFMQRLTSKRVSIGYESFTGFRKLNMADPK